MGIALKNVHFFYYVDIERQSFLAKFGTDSSVKVQGVQKVTSKMGLDFLDTLDDCMSRNTMRNIERLTVADPWVKINKKRPRVGSNCNYFLLHLKKNIM